MTDEPGGGRAMVGRHVIVHGEVQGVFFRASAVEAAADAGVAGWVRNRDDGTVEMVVEGDPERVDRLIDWARGGPPRARVTRVEVAERAPEGLDGFGQR